MYANTGNFSYIQQPQDKIRQETALHLFATKKCLFLPNLSLGPKAKGQEELRGCVDVGNLICYTVILTIT